METISTRSVEVIRVGTIGLETNYPGKQVVRLRDLSTLYEGGPLKGLSSAFELAEKCRTGKSFEVPGSKDDEGNDLVKPWQCEIKSPEVLDNAVIALIEGVQDLFTRMKGKRLSGINVEIWDQISGAFVGVTNTDKNGTLVLPTDRQFVEVLQWKLAGGGYSDCFNGERAAGTPGLFFYFHCNEYGASQIESFQGVSGQKAVWDGEWHPSGFFSRPALKFRSGQNDLVFIGLDPQGHRSFQFLWYCSSTKENYTIFSYAQGKGVSTTPGFRLELNSGVLKAHAGTASATGTTTIESEKWYMIQVNTRTIPTGYDNVNKVLLFSMQMDVYLGTALEASASKDDVAASGFVYGVLFGCAERDGLDEIRHLNRNLDASEIANYAAFLKTGRYPGKSDGALGVPGW